MDCSTHPDIVNRLLAFVQAISAEIHSGKRAKRPKCPYRGSKPASMQTPDLPMHNKE